MSWFWKFRCWMILEPIVIIFLIVFSCFSAFHLVCQDLGLISPPPGLQRTMANMALMALVSRFSFLMFGSHSLAWNANSSYCMQFAVGSLSSKGKDVCWCTVDLMFLRHHQVDDGSDYTSSGETKTESEPEESQGGRDTRDTCWV